MGHMGVWALAKEARTEAGPSSKSPRWGCGDSAQDGCRAGGWVARVNACPSGLGWRLRRGVRIRRMAGWLVVDPEWG
jgi:hypothetical protein